MHHRDRELADLGWPICAELVLSTVVIVVATAMVGRESDAAAGALGLGNQLAQAVFLLTRVLGAGVGAVVARQRGAGGGLAMETVMRAAIASSVWLGVLLAALLVFCASSILSMADAPKTVGALAAPFVAAMGPALAIEAVLQAALAALRSGTSSAQVMRIVVLTQLVNLAILWPCYGWFGITGVACAFAASRAIGAIACVYALRAAGTTIRARDWFVADGEALRQLSMIGLPAAVEAIWWRACHLVALSTIAANGERALAASAYIMQVQSLVMLPALAMGVSAEILVGHAVGSKNYAEALVVIRRCLRIGMAATALGLLVAVAGGARWMSLFSQDAATQEAAASALLWVVVVEPGRCLNLVCINALRGAGDVRVPMLWGLFSMTAFLACGSIVFVSWCGMGLFGWLLASAADEWVRGCAMWWRTKRVSQFLHRA